MVYSLGDETGEIIEPSLHQEGDLLNPNPIRMCIFNSTAVKDVIETPALYQIVYYIENSGSSF